MHLNSTLIFEEYVKQYFQTGQNILEIGPSGFPSLYFKLADNENLNWNTLDIGDDYIEGGEISPKHISTSNEYKYPISDSEYDIVFSGQVMEHVKKIWLWIDELLRITRKGGLLIIISPVSWDYHECPVDCWRIYPEGMKALFEEKNVDILVNDFLSLEKQKLPANVRTMPGNSTFTTEGELGRKSKLLLNLYKLRVINKVLPPFVVAYDNVFVCRKK
jgi:SAM-dependent methyltransferase